MSRFFIRSAAFQYGRPDVIVYIANLDRKPQFLYTEHRNQKQKYGKKDG